MTALRIEGPGLEARDLGFDDLAALPDQVENVGSLAPGRQGGAVPLRAVLDAVGVGPGAREVTLESADGKFSQRAPLDGLRSALLVYRLGDGPLPADRGGPIRFLVPNLEECGIPGVDRCTNVKALGRIRLA